MYLFIGELILKSHYILTDLKYQFLYISYLYLFIYIMFIKIIVIDIFHHSNNIKIILMQPKQL